VRVAFLVVQRSRSWRGGAVTPLRIGGSNLKKE